MKYILFALLIAVAMSGMKFKRGGYVPFHPGRQNVFTFGCGMGSDWGSLYGVSSANVNFAYRGLPSWVTVQNGAMIAGTPGRNAGAQVVTVTYNDANGRSRTENVVLAPSGTSSSATVNVPAGDASSLTAVPLASFADNIYVPGNTSPAPGSSSVSETTLTTIVLPAMSYPTPARLTLTPPDAPTTNTNPRSNLPTASPEEESAVIVRVEAAVKGLANALDAINRANSNINSAEDVREKLQTDLNNALNFLATTKASLSDNEGQQRSNSDSVTIVTNDISNLQSQVDAATKNNNDLKGKIADLEGQLTTANGQVPVLQKNLDDILAAIANGQKALGDVEDAYNKALSNIARLKKIISDAQAALDAAPANIKRAKEGVRDAIDRITQLERALADAKEAKAAADKALADAEAVLVNAPRTIADATAELNIANANLPGILAAINNAKANLEDLARRRNSANDAIANNNKLIDDLNRRLSVLRGQLADGVRALDNFNSQLAQARVTLTTLRNNQGTHDNNVGTLTTQLGLAEAAVNNARNAIEENNNQLAQNRKLLDAARTALERARTEKALADQAMTEVVNRNGGTFPYPYIPGTGPFAMPGVTGAVQLGTVNPYAPGTVFGSGPGTTGAPGVNSGLPIAVPAGSPIPSQATPFGLLAAGSARVISTSQSANLSPSAVFGRSDVNAVSVTNPLGGTRLTRTGGCGRGPVGAPRRGSGIVERIMGTTIYLANSGEKINFDGCTNISGSLRPQAEIDWSGWYNTGKSVAEKITCK